MTYRPIDEIFHIFSVGDHRQQILECRSLLQLELDRQVSQPKGKHNFNP